MFNLLAEIDGKGGGVRIRPRKFVLTAWRGEYSVPRDYQGKHLNNPAVFLALINRVGGL